MADIALLLGGVLTFTFIVLVVTLVGDNKDYL